MACICLDTSSIPHEVRNYGLDIWDLAQRGTEEGLLRALNSEDRSESDVNYVYGIKKQTPLMVAILWNHTKRVEMLLNAGADINIQDRDGNTALILAVQENNNDVVRMLLAKKEVDINVANVDEYSALHCAVRNCNYFLTQLLIYHGADLNMKSVGGFTVLFMAIDKKDNRMAKLLIEQDSINVNLRNERYNTALHWAAGRNNHEVVKLLIARGAILDLQNDWGYTALHHAARRRSRDMLKTLIIAGANWRIESYDNLMAHQFKGLEMFQSMILKEMKWSNARNFLMFLYMMRFQGHDEYFPPAIPGQENMTRVFTIYDLTRYITSYLLNISAEDLALLERPRDIEEEEI